MDPITEFKGEHRWLSNFFPVDVRVDGIVYPSAEHAYMSYKCDNSWWKAQCQDRAISAAEIKKRAKNVSLVENWEDIKIGVMQKVLEAKFNIPAFRQALLDTGDAYIMEGNWWHDTFWGVDLNSNIGENRLGILIMEIRTNIQ